MLFFNVHFMDLFFTPREPEKALHLYLLNMTWDIVELVKGVFCSSVLPHGSQYYTLEGTKQMVGVIESQKVFASLG